MATKIPVERAHHVFRKLTPREKTLYERLRSDRMIRLSLVPAMVGMGSQRAIAKVLIAQGCPIYRIGDRGAYRVFSRDVIEALNGLDIVHNTKWRKQLDSLWKNGIRHGLTVGGGSVAITGGTVRRGTRQDNERLQSLSARGDRKLRGTGDK